MSVTCPTKQRFGEDKALQVSGKPTQKGVAQPGHCIKR